MCRHFLYFTEEKICANVDDQRMITLENNLWWTVGQTTEPYYGDLWYLFWLDLIDLVQVNICT